MADNLYIGSSIAISVPCTIDGIALDSGDVQSAKITFKRPDKTTGEWTATVVGDALEYETLESDINQSGIWVLQPEVTFISGATIPGSSGSMIIKPRFV